MYTLTGECVWTVCTVCDVVGVWKHLKFLEKLWP